MTEENGKKTKLKNQFRTYLKNQEKAGINCSDLSNLDLLMMVQKWFKKQMTTNQIEGVKGIIRDAKGEHRKYMLRVNRKVSEYAAVLYGQSPDEELKIAMKHFVKRWILSGHINIDEPKKAQQTIQLLLERSIVSAYSHRLELVPFDTNDRFWEKKAEMTDD